MRKILIIPNFVLWCFLYALFCVPYLIIGRIREKRSASGSPGSMIHQEN
ncbi:MAG TPA: hypothetical protein PK727_00510 [Bacteroidales bacterium]|nr:hypothetical protein [Bacteroidales bacterium]